MSALLFLATPFICGCLFVGIVAAVWTFRAERRWRESRTPLAIVRRARGGVQ